MKYKDLYFEDVLAPKEIQEIKIIEKTYLEKIKFFDEW